MKKTGIIYHPDFLLHTKEGHPEHSGRLVSIVNLLEKNNMVDFIEPVVALKSEVALVHDQEYIFDLEKIIKSGATYLDGDTYLTPDSFRVALLSVGAAITAMRMVMSGERKVSFSLGRPPGHHAEPDLGMGFCLFNNIAIAAKVALKEFSLKRILIIDWDVHHGNGTQKVFYDSDAVFFISLHQSPAYPGTGMIDEKGEGLGYGYNLNIPMAVEAGDIEYLEAFKKIIMPAAEMYKPELIMISAGYDGYFEDPLASVNLTIDGYSKMAGLVKEMADKYCQGRVVFCLEGGYHLEGLAKGVIATIKVFS